MNKRDKLLIKYVNKHYSELLEELKEINGFEEFCQDKLINKAIKMDILQIGENINHLTDEAKLQLNKKDLIGVVDFRNQVAHGYISLKEEVIWKTIQEDLPRIMLQINSIK